MAKKKIIKMSIRRALAKNGQKQIWLADKLGLHETTLSRIANSEHVNTSAIEKIAKVFDMTVIEFLALGE